MKNLYWLRVVVLQSALFLVASAHVYAQQSPAGVVTALQGKAQLTRPAAPGPVALRFKDGVLLRDTIDTQEKSLVRVLFGGKSTVTLRELSRLEVREEMLPTGATRSTMELSSGAMLVNVAKQLMGPGDEVVIRTPNAVAAVRGTLVFTQVIQAFDQAIFTVLSGLVSLQGQLIGPNTQAIVSGTGIKISTISQQQANQILSQSQIGGKPSSENSQTQTATATGVADVLVALAGGPPPSPPSAPPPPSPPPPPPPPTIPSSSFPLTFPLASPAPPFVVANGSLNTGASSLFQLSSGQTVTQSQPLLIATSANINIGGNGFNNSGNFTSTSPAALFQLTDSAASIGGSLVKMDGGTLTTAGSLIELTNASLNLGTHAVVQILNASPGNTLTNTVGPVIKITGGSLTADFLGLGDGSQTYNFHGSLLDLTNATVTLRKFGEDDPHCDNCGDNAIFTLAANEPLLKLNNSTLTLKDNTHGDIGFASSLVSQTGVLLSATNSTINVTGGFFWLNDVTLSDTIPQIQLTNSTITQKKGTGTDPFDSDSLIKVHGLATIGGSLIAATNSIINSDSNLLEIQGGGGQLVMNPANPVAVFSGGSYTFGADTTPQLDPGSNTSNSLFNLQGSNTNTDGTTGLGTDQPIKGNGGAPVGTLLEATGGATIEVKAGPGDSLAPGLPVTDPGYAGTAGNAIRIDTALLEAALPLIHLVGTGTTATTLTTAGDTINIFKSNVVSTGPVISLDNGLIHVTSGALITLTNGSNMNVTGDLLKLISGSQINVHTGPLILVTGTSGGGSSPASSTLNVSGALFDFGNTSGNNIIVNNPQAGNASRGGPANNQFSVYISGVGSAVTIGTNPVKNDPGGNSISITGALIEARNGGKVTITAP